MGPYQETCSNGVSCPSTFGSIDVLTLAFFLALAMADEVGASRASAARCKKNDAPSG